MRFREGINLEKRLSSEEDKIVTTILNSTALFIQAVNSGNILTSDNNPAVLEIFRTNNQADTFIMQPKRGFKLGWSLDNYAIKNEGYDE